MLNELRVRNYALIKDLIFKPGSGFNIITGETGAGKSIMLGALGMILGDRIDSFAVAQNEERCVVEANFKIADYHLQSWFESQDLEYSDELIVRREISVSGKSRAFINDSPAQLGQLKELGQFLIDIHSQHDNLHLFKKAFQFKVLDSFSNTTAEFLSFRNQFDRLNKLKEAHARLVDQDQKLAEDKEYKRYLLDELQAAQLIEGEEDSLTEEYSALSYADQNSQLLSTIKHQLSHSEAGVSDQLAIIKNSMGQIAKNDVRFDEVSKRINELYFSLKDLVSEIDRLEMVIESNPERLEHINNRLSLLHQLATKHKTSALIEKKKALEKELEHYGGTEAELKNLETQIKNSELECLALAKYVSEQRIKHSQILEKKVNELIIPLGMPDSQVKIELSSAPDEPLSVYGIDDCNFLFSPAKGKSFNPIQNMASGGEISRIMLVLKSILANKNVMPTIIFDEVDAGISGDVAIKMSDMLAAMSNGIQLICITHLPQIASKAHKHFYVYKLNEQGETSSKIRELEPNERLEEIAEMMGGKNYGSSILEGARQLLNREV